MTPRRQRASRSIAIFGGTFDPIHVGHILVAEVAARRFGLSQIHFVPSSRPPHKDRQHLTSFWHRYAMVTLACSAQMRFIPSLAEAPLDSLALRIFYSVDTVAAFRREHPRDRVFFIIGADSFLEIAAWKNSHKLLDSCDFIIANRPGIRFDALRQAIPPEMLGPRNYGGRNSITLQKSAVHLLAAVTSDVSSTDIRRRCMRGTSIRGLVPPSVEDYIHKQALYR